MVETIGIQDLKYYRKLSLKIKPPSKVNEYNLIFEGFLMITKLAVNRVKP